MVEHRRRRVGINVSKLKKLYNLKLREIMATEAALTLPPKSPDEEKRLVQKYHVQARDLSSLLNRIGNYTNQEANNGFKLNEIPDFTTALSIDFAQVAPTTAKKPVDFTAVALGQAVLDFTA